MLTCTVCGKQFERKGSRGPIPKYCSGECSRAPRKEAKREYDKRYHAKYYERNRSKVLTYGFHYNRRPEVRRRYAARERIKWHDPDYRARSLERNRAWYRAHGNYRSVYPGVTISQPYTGHQWLDMAREAVIRSGQVDPLAPWSDDRYDEMGEALLALLEGRDMQEAVKEYRRSEYVSRHRTIRIGEWVDEDGESYAERMLPSAESAEAVVIRRSGEFDWGTPRFSDVSTRNRHMKNKQSQPSRRRTKDGRGWMKHRR